LRDVQRLGRASEVQMLSDRDEVAQLPQVNVHHDLLPTLIPTEYYKALGWVLDASVGWCGA
jgi:hypothetical protein